MQQLCNIHWKKKSNIWNFRKKTCEIYGEIINEKTKIKSKN